MSAEEALAKSTANLPDVHRPSSPAFSSVCERSDRSKEEPPNVEDEKARLHDVQIPFSPAFSSVSERSDRSKEELPDFKDEKASLPDVHRPSSPVFSSVSERSDRSKEELPDFEDEKAGLPDVHRPSTPAFSSVSERTDRSKEEPPDFQDVKARLHDVQIPFSPAFSSVCEKSDRSKEEPSDFKDEKASLPDVHRPSSPAFSSASERSDRSKEEPPDFEDEKASIPDVHRPSSPAFSSASERSDRSKEEPPDFQDEKARLPDVHRPSTPAFSSVSERTDRSKEEPPDFQDVKARLPDVHRPSSPAFSSVSERSDQSKEEPPDFQDVKARLPDVHRPSSPAFSSVSERSDRSKEEPPDFQDVKARLPDVHRPSSPAFSSVSERTDRSKEEPSDFKDEKASLPDVHRPSSPAFSSASERTDRSKEEPPDFEDEKARLPDVHRPSTPAFSSVSERSDRSKEEPPDFEDEKASTQQTGKHETLKAKRDATTDDPLDFTQEIGVNYRLRENRKKWILATYENSLGCVEFDSEIYNISKKKKVVDGPVQTYNDIFCKSGKAVRTVLTQGEAGIGKTFHTRKFMVDWANGNSNQRIDFIVPLHFNELTQDQSMEELLDNFLSNDRELQASSYDELTVAFVLDGLENCKVPLDFKKNKTLTNIKETASMNVLLTNLIKGKLLPNALLWIISQPSGVKKIPSEYINKITECQETNARGRLTEIGKKKILLEYEKELNQVKKDSELYEITTNERHKDKLVEYQDVFVDSKKTVRIVLTQGAPGVGKTFQTRMLMFDWAKGKSNKQIDFIVPLHFKELNPRGDKLQSMEDLLNNFFNDAQKPRAPIYDKCKVALVLDGLEELPLDFDRNSEHRDMKMPASMDVLLTNLIKGNLLPNALIWIISQPSGVKKIPPEYINKVTECRETNARGRLTEIGKKKILLEYEKELNQVKKDSELYEIATNEGHKDKLVEYQDVFVDSKKTVRIVLTQGAPGVGKTFQTRMLMFDWAKGKSNKQIDFIVPLHFKELNPRGDKLQSMEDLLNNFFNDAQKPRAPIYDKCKVALVLDGLEELPLDFDRNSEHRDMKMPASMDVLLTNLIKGNLLPNALLWIISQPSGVKKIPPEYINKVTECRETLERRRRLQSSLRDRFRKKLNANGGEDEVNHPNQKNTEHIIRKDSFGEVADDGKSEQNAKKCKKVNETADIFKDDKGKEVRTVLTIGEADIGKSFHVQKFIKAWAENKSQRSFFTRFTSLFREDDAEVLFPLDFSELNLIKDKVSLVELLNHLFEETKRCVISNYALLKVVFVLDGLDSYKGYLDFSNGEILTDVRERVSVDVLLTNLIRGNLLPSATVWITSRPSAANELPDDCIVRVTEIREKPDVVSQRKIKIKLKEHFTRVSEGIDNQQVSTLLNEIYTDLYIIEGERGEVNAENESRLVQNAKFKPVDEETSIKYCDIFKPASDNKPLKTVLTTGVAGIGKTFASMKYILDWAEGKANENIYFIFPFPFRELNLRKNEEHSFEELLHQFFPAMKTSEITDYNRYSILIVLDGFDECRLDLEFNENDPWRDLTKQTSVSVLLANLIQGNLLPEAQIWITSRPAASNNIPAKNVDRVAEVRGFNDEQKEEYFRKRFSDKDLAEKILSHVKKSRSLYIMCHIPVFCWITSKVLEDFVVREQDKELPRSLTDMYAHFLELQRRQTSEKFDKDKTGESNDETVLSLAKLAFEELEKGNLLFTAEELNECGIDVTKAAVYSGLLTQIKREDCGLYKQQLFCFVHLSIQEFLAALHVQHTFSDKDENLLTNPPSVVADHLPLDLYKKAVDKALDSKHGDWDMFLRFLLGLSLETNQDLLRGLLKKSKNLKETNKEIVQYIKDKINEDTKDPDKNLNLFYCLNELNDHSLIEEMKKYLQSETSFESFTTSQWSALTFVLLTSDENLDVFDLKKYLKSETVLLGMLPVVKVSKTALLSWCELTEASCKGLTSSVLSSASSNLTMLDLSRNDLLDSGVNHLAEGLKSLHCKLEILKLSGCQVTEKGCLSLATAVEFNAASPLKHLDLSYNDPGDSGVKRLSAIAENPEMKLQEVRLDHGGAHRLKPGLKKYGVNLRLNENTASKRLVLSEGNRKAKTTNKVKEKVARPKNEERFKRTQVFCDEGLKKEDICYWEVEWEGTVGIAVSYQGVGREWDRGGGLGTNEMSWSLLCSNTGYTALHGKTAVKNNISLCQKIGVLLDGERGTLSYYNVSSSEQLSLIHTFDAKFTDLLYPAFWFQRGSITLCDI